MRVKCENSDYERDELGALILVNQEKINLAKENQQLKTDINNLREEVQNIKKILGVES
jgi:hypothetical protein|tara:strand:+ start:84 stop:257 length:174 start_codon:yes stop_codon:yes gene_type:complete